MRLKILFRKNLNMTPGKLAAQSVHAALSLQMSIGEGLINPFTSVVVLGVSDAKFKEAQLLEGVHIVKDAGYTEVAPGTETCLSYLEEDPRGEK